MSPGLTFAVGDIHGRYDLLVAAFDWIVARAGEGPADIICLGDYVDRGPDSRRVVEALMAGPPRPGDSLRCLVGNHEEMMLQALAAENMAAGPWLRNGGLDTLSSYGMVPQTLPDPRLVPRDHVRWLDALPTMIEDEHRIYVHAGLEPGVPLAEQTREKLLWIREPFVSADHDFGKHVVHGHTPVPEGPDLKPFRTNLDTGAVWTGMLSVGVFDPARPGGPSEIRAVTV